MNEDINESNVDKFRKRWETDDHWYLRREFILTHCDSFELERLLCLSQLFLNIETMKTVYSPDLMLLIERLSSQVGAVKEFRAKRKQLDESPSYKRPKREEEPQMFYNQRNQRGGHYNPNRGYGNQRRF
ncbi:CDKN2A-interacting protein-like protein [Leptotrombidium deliense]|uniref:CDKN2A-interacting protein-like protein n=1 Tax=Leptotrombidium deliense TaxID=299467 RepID=A0A443RZU5_9ACAR|nr:CDKN2A-interacting protein-like protein [Leptotrombidium deliense]